MSATLLLSSVLLQAGSVAAPMQSPATPSLVRRSPVAVKDGGTYHVATGAWTRSAFRRSVPDGQEVVYSNTSNVGGLYTVGIGSLQYPGQIAYDEGALPALGNGTVGFGTEPDQVSYEITGFEIRYCDFKTAPMSSSWTYTFYESFDPAVDPASGAAPNAVVDLVNLPANGCWTVTVDLTGGSEFKLVGDGGAAAPGWQDDPARDSFAYGIEYRGALGGEPAGVFFAGDPEFTGGIGGYGAGTYFLDPTQAATSCGTTGLGALDGWTLTDGATTVRTPPIYSNGVGCGQGARPFGSTYLRMFATEGPGSDIGRSFCIAAPNSTGAVGRMQATGRSIASQGRLTLSCTDLPPNVFGFFLVSRSPDQVSTPGGSSGNLCLGKPLGRLDEPWQVKNSGPNGTVSLSTELGEWSIDAQPIGGGVVPAIAGETWYYQFWHRDVAGSGPTSNFTEGLRVDFN